MDSFEFILYALVGLSLVIRPFLKKGKESRGLFETEDVPAPEVSPVPTTSWEDLMKELKKATEQQMNKPEERVEERVEPIGVVESQPAPAQVSVETSQTNISKDIKAIILSHLVRGNITLNNLCKNSHNLITIKRFPKLQIPSIRKVLSLEPFHLLSFLKDL